MNTLILTRAHDRRRYGNDAPEMSIPSRFLEEVPNQLIENLGGRSPVLGYDAAQYAVAARELAEHGRLATSFALPIELSQHPRPPWPLAAVQPGLVVAEALVDRIVPHALVRPSQREWLSLAWPMASFFALALLIVFTSARLLGAASEGTRWIPWLGGGVIALGFLLDPEAQHFAAGGFTELPFTLGVVLALALVASGAAVRRPWLFGLLLGVTGAFRANMLWLAPAFAVGVAVLAPPSLRLRAGLAVMLGYAVPLVPWWLYKWHSFGAPSADLSRWMLWEGVEGRTWFTMMHLPETPHVPAGPKALALLADKIGRNLGTLSLSLATGPRALWLGALITWLWTRPPKPLGVAGVLVLVQLALGLLAAAASIPWLRYVFPARIPFEAAGVLATWALIARVPDQPLGPSGRQVLRAGVAMLALLWATWQCGLGLAEARSTAADRGIPSVATLNDLGARLNSEMAPDEALMSNLGPTLAWHARRPVLHLALGPEDLDACRSRLTSSIAARVSAAWPMPGSG